MMSSDKSGLPVTNSRTQSEKRNRGTRPESNQTYPSSSDIRTHPYLPPYSPPHSDSRRSKWAASSSGAQKKGE